MLMTKRRARVRIWPDFPKECRCCQRFMNWRLFVKLVILLKYIFLSLSSLPNKNKKNVWLVETVLCRLNSFLTTTRNFFSSKSVSVPRRTNYFLFETVFTDSFYCACWQTTRTLMPEIPVRAGSRQFQTPYVSTEVFVGPWPGARQLLCKFIYPWLAAGTGPVILAASVTISPPTTRCIPPPSSHPRAHGPQLRQFGAEAANQKLGHKVMGDSSAAGIGG